MLGDKTELAFIKKRLEKENDERAKVGLYYAAYLLGQHDYLENLISLLQNENYIIRCAAANTLAELSFSKPDAILVLQSLSKALKKETTIAAKSSIKTSIKAIKKTQ
jgi:HEAT repeat protein